MTPRHWNDPPAQRWSTETLRRDLEGSRQARRETFALGASLAIGLGTLIVLWLAGQS